MKKTFFSRTVAHEKSKEVQRECIYNALVVGCAKQVSKSKPKFSCKDRKLNHMFTMRYLFHNASFPFRKSCVPSEFVIDKLHFDLNLK